jgi:hypothetical protein
VIISNVAKDIDLDLKQRYPRSRMEKLGVKADSVVSVLGVEDDTFRAEVEGQTKAVSFGRIRKGSTLIIYAAKELVHLDRLTALRDAITQDGAVWVVWPKGQKAPGAVREDDVRRAAIAQGLVDVKVMSFSDILSGLKLVIPVKNRKRAAKNAPKNQRA